jgi:hypothetical protein
VYAHAHTVKLFRAAFERESVREWHRLSKRLRKQHVCIKYGDKDANALKKNSIWSAIQCSCGEQQLLPHTAVATEAAIYCPQVVTVAAAAANVLVAMKDP